MDKAFSYIHLTDSRHGGVVNILEDRNENFNSYFAEFDVSDHQWTIMNHILPTYMKVTIIQAEKRFPFRKKTTNVTVGIFTVQEFHVALERVHMGGQV
jgi:hypothetical protein